MNDRLTQSIDAWRAKLSPEAYAVCRMGGTERPGSGKFNKHAEPGVYTCVCCASPLFRSDSKYDSGSGWPSFFQPASATSIREIEDSTHGMLRIEVRCAACDSHLGHVFPDGPRPTGMRYCINSLALDFTAAPSEPAQREAAP